MQDTMKSHSAAWDALSSAERRRFGQAAQVRRAQVVEQMEVVRAETTVALAEVRAESQSMLSHQGLPNHFSSCRFSPPELESIAKQFLEAKGAAQAAATDPSL